MFNVKNLIIMSFSVIIDVLSHFLRFSERLDFCHFQACHQIYELLNFKINECSMFAQNYVWKTKRQRAKEGSNH
jgi:hypothetical protein